MQVILLWSGVSQVQNTPGNGPGFHYGLFHLGPLVFKKCNCIRCIIYQNDHFKHFFITSRCIVTPLVTRQVCNRLFMFIADFVILGQVHWVFASWVRVNSSGQCSFCEVGLHVHWHGWEMGSRNEQSHSMFSVVHLVTTGPKFFPVHD